MSLISISDDIAALLSDLFDSARSLYVLGTLSPTKPRYAKIELRAREVHIREHLASKHAAYSHLHVVWKKEIAIIQALCDACWMPVSHGLRCKGCKLAVYCGKRCQKL